MVNFNECVENIKDNHGFKHNSHDDSFYRTYIVEGGQFLQLRVSNHGTHLWTWLEKDYDPSVALANISIVFTQDGRWESNTAVDMGDKKRSYSIIQYIYNCSVLDDNDILRINNRIQDIVTNRGYLDPLSDNETKKAQVYTLEPNQEPKQIIQENKQTTNINKNMKKQTIKLNESQLRGLIKESIENVLNENKWDGNEDVFYEDDELFDRLEEIRVALQHISSFIESIGNKNPRVQGKTQELLQNVNNLRSALNADSSFVKSGLLQQRNPWGNLGTGVYTKKPHDGKNDPYIAGNAYNSIKLARNKKLQIP